MPEETIALTQRALHRLKVSEAVTDRRLTQTEAGRQLGLTTLQSALSCLASWRPVWRVSRASRRCPDCSVA